MRSEAKTPGPIALTIAGFDPSSGAGITADLAVFAAHGVFGISAITALTVQSTIGVRRSQTTSPEFLSATLACLQEDLPPQGIKIGMLGRAEQVRAVANFLQPLRTTAARPIVVLDPVLRSSSGSVLLNEDGLGLLQTDLLPLVDVVTPNAEELADLTGLPCDTSEQITLAAQALTARYSDLTVIATGGDRPQPDDLLLHEGVLTMLRGERIETSATHGTGCAFSSALLCHMLHGDDMEAAATAAKRYVEQAMRTAVPRGRGRGPMNLLWPISQHAGG
jgi:hydroxymethylpyrimidine/phosphomethylpyrimidine kinase